METIALIKKDGKGGLFFYPSRNKNLIKQLTTAGINGNRPRLRLATKEEIEKLMDLDSHKALIEVKEDAQVQSAKKIEIKEKIETKEEAKKEINPESKTTTTDQAKKKTLKTKKQ